MDQTQRVDLGGEGVYQIPGVADIEGVGIQILHFLDPIVEGDKRATGVHSVVERADTHLVQPNN